MAPKQEVDSRSVLRKRLGELREQQNENKKGKQVKVDKLNTLNNTLKKKVKGMSINTLSCFDLTHAPLIDCSTSQYWQQKMYANRLPTSKYSKTSSYSKPPRLLKRR